MNPLYSVSSSFHPLEQAEAEAAFQSSWYPSSSDRLRSKDCPVLCCAPHHPGTCVIACFFSAASGESMLPVRTLCLFVLVSPPCSTLGGQSVQRPWVAVTGHLLRKLLGLGCLPRLITKCPVVQVAELQERKSCPSHTGCTGREIMPQRASRKVVVWPQHIL